MAELLSAGSMANFGIGTGCEVIVVLVKRPLDKVPPTPSGAQQCLASPNNTDPNKPGLGVRPGKTLTD